MAPSLTWSLASRMCCVMPTVTWQQPWLTSANALVYRCHCSNVCQVEWRGTGLAVEVRWKVLLSVCSDCIWCSYKSKVYITYACLLVYMYPCLYVRVYACMYICMLVSLYASTYDMIYLLTAIGLSPGGSRCIYICMDVCFYVCVCVRARARARLYIYRIQIKVNKLNYWISEIRNLNLKYKGRGRSWTWY